MCHISEDQQPERYVTRDEAIQRQIVDPIEETGDAKATEYDVEAIAQTVLCSDSSGWFLCVAAADEFWHVVAMNATEATR